jgi:hypothetical protein
MSTVMGGETRNEGDRKKLIKFLLDTRSVLALFVEYPQVLLPENMHREFYEAWPDVDDAISDSVLILEGEHPERLRRPLPSSLAFNAEELDSRLAFFGLTGIQLQMKLKSFYNTYDELMEDPSFVQVISTQPNTDEKRAVQKKKRGLMGWLLEKINSIIGSLSKVIPSADIIKEFKEMAEYGYKESQGL